jgi:hypothetical protein
MIHPTADTLRFAALAALALMTIAGAVEAKPAWPVPRGTFIQWTLMRTWTPERWRAEFRDLKEAGMDIIIFGDVCDSKERVTYYPTKIEGLRQQEDCPDLVENCLKYAKEAGFKVFLGLNFNGDWWRKAANDPEWLFAEMRLGNQVADELHARYRARYPKTFVGWYWVWEVDNLNYRTPAQQETLAKALDINVRHLHEKYPGMPVMLCPFMNYRLGPPQDYAAMWKYVFKNTALGKGDIFCPQDCIGAGGLILDVYQAWFKELAKAVRTKPGLRFWVDSETFDQTDWTPAPLGRFVKQLKGLQGIVSDYVTFAYSHYYSPGAANPEYHRQYVRYVKTGKLETAPPPAVPSVTLTRRENGNVRLNWPAMSGDVCGYNIYRNGHWLARVMQKRGPRPKNGPGTQWTDQKPLEGAEYEVAAFDFVGNVGPRVRAKP